MIVRTVPPQLRPALLSGLVGSACVTVGASQSASPFSEHSAGSWFFQWSLGTSAGAGSGADNERLLGVILVYAGLVLLVGSWLSIVRMVRAQPPAQRIEIGHLALTLVAWSVPLLVVGPLFSHDAYSYAAQGQMLSEGISPYVHSAAALRGGPFLPHVDTIWRQAIAPYGPGWERLVEGYVTVSGHHLLGVLALLRASALISLAAIAWGVPALAKSTGHDPAQALVWSVLNPLVLLTLLGGMHNDALMLALVVVGLVAAQRGHPLLGVVLCALGAEVKAPALLAVVFVGWWASERQEPARRVARIAGYLALAAVVLTAVSVAGGLGWGWVHAAVTPGKVVSWLDPATAVGLALSHLTSALGLGAHRSTWTAVSRATGLAVAAATAIWLLLHSDRRSGPEALGVSLLALALLGPVVWPWYETWGIAVMATAASAYGAWKRWVVVGLSALGAIADFPSSRVLFGGTPGLVVAGWAVVVFGAVCYFRFVVLRTGEPVT
ncbi:MAG: polyprenol phosphomannose-dependent alpha 1,6 mannosyltransferase MptB [Acidimicrobiales bacterium]